MSKLLVAAAAAAPHSMGLERVIAVYEKIRSNLRVSLSTQMMNDILFIKLNMPCIACFDVR